jgi:hypothetical protein
MNPRLMMVGVVAVCGLAACALAAPPGPASRPDPADIVFAEDFEHFEPARWSNIKGPKTVQIVPAGREGGSCAQVTATQGENTGGYLYKMIKPGLETAYLRFYVKFEKGPGAAFGRNQKD